MQRLRPPARMLVAILAAVIAAASLGAGLWWQQRNRALLEQRFDTLVEDLTLHLKGRMRAYALGLSGTRAALVAAGPSSINHETFTRYAEARSLDAEFPGARGFGFIRRVTRAEEQAFLAAAQLEGRPDFQIRQLHPHDTERFVIQYIEPEGRNRQAVGLDIASELRRHHAAVAAMSNAEPTLTPPITLVQANGQINQGLLFLLPIYTTGSTPQTLEDRWASGIGWVYAPLVMDEVLDETGFHPDEIAYSITDNHDGEGGAPFHMVGSTDGNAPSILRRRVDLVLYGRLWTVEVRALPRFTDSLGLIGAIWVSAGVGVLGSLLWLLVSMRLASLRRQLAAAQERAALTAHLEQEVINRTSELRMREARFKALTELSSDWYWEIGSEGRFTAVSRGIARVGLDPDRVIGKTRRQLAVDPTHPALDHYDALLSEFRTFRDFAYDILGDDGVVRHILVSGEPIWDSQGAFAGYRGSGRNVTTEMEALNTLANREAMLQAILDSALDGIMAFAAVRDDGGAIIDFRFLMVNRAAETLTGQNGDALIGHRLLDVMRGHREDGLFARYCAVVDRNCPALFDHHYAHEGMDSWLRIQAAPCGDGLVVAFSDVTATKTQETLLRESEARFQALANLSPAGIYQTDAEGGVTYVNPAMCALAGRPLANMLGDGWTEAVHPDEREAIAAAWARGRKATVVLQAEFRFLHPDGTVRWVANRSARQLDAEGRAAGWVGVTLDISDRVAGEAELRRSLDEVEEARSRAELHATNLAALAEQLVMERERAEAASEAKSDFVATMSHEVRTPLNGVIGFAELLLASPLSDEQREWVELQREAGRTLLAVISDVLDFSKIEAGRLELDPHPFELPRLAMGAGELVRVTAEEKGIALRVAVDPRLPPWVRGDATRIRQVLLNLLNNAVKFTERGHVSLTVQPGADGRVRFEVLDTGIGIALDDQARLFQAFSQVDCTTARRFGGTGLGLAICRRLVEMMGGAIGLESTLGTGSVFWFDLPLETEAITPLARCSPSPAPFSAGVRVLLAEDVKANQVVAAGILRRAGHQVTIAADGLQALQAVTRSDFDIILMDLRMPGMDGLEATRAIRALGGNRGSTPIVALTAEAGTRELHACMAAGMEEVLTKPFQPERLLEVVARTIGGRHTAGAPALGEPLPPPGLDNEVLKALEDALGKDPLNTVLNDLTEDIPSWQIRLSETLPNQCADIAHQLVSMLGNFGLASASAAARQLERAARSGVATSSMVSSVLEALEIGRSMLLNHLQQDGGPPRIEVVDEQAISRPSITEA